MGSNIERYAVLLAGPLLLCACVKGPTSPGATPRVQSGRSAPALSIALIGIAIFTVWGPVRETKAVAGNESTRASYYAPVLRFLANHGGALDRVEVPLTRSHWEAALMAPTVSLARGWEKQLDEKYDGVLLDPGLTAAGYARWLHEEAVSYVALPDTPLDPSSAGEGRLIRRGLLYLHAVFRSRHWTVYAVRGATPLLEGPGRLTSLGHDSFTLRATAPGRFLVRVRFTRYWTLTAGSGRVTEAPGGWTYVTANRPNQQLRITARFSLARALG